MMGTRHYISPEQALCWWRDYGPWTDIYSVGCLVYKLATGRAPFAHLQGAAVLRAQVQEEPPPLEARMAVPAGFADWVSCCLKKWPYQRFQCAADAARALLALGEPDGSESDTVDPIFRGWYVGRQGSAHVLGHDHGEQVAEMFDDSEATLVPEAELIELEMDANSWRQADDFTLRCVKRPTVTDWRRAVFETPVRQLMGVGLELYAHRTHPMIGREGERDRLWKLFNACTESGEPRTVVVNGRPGEGKTRLGQWLSWRAQELGLARTVKVTARAKSGPLKAIQSMVEQLLHVSDLDDKEMQERLERLLQPRGVAETEIKAFYRTLQGGFGAGLEWAHLEMVAELIRVYAKERPLILWIEDAHYNAQSIDLIRIIMRETSNIGSVLCLMTIREDLFGTDSEESEAFHRVLDDYDVDLMDLGPMSAKEHTRLVHELLVLDSDLVVQVAERTAGNPLFAVQLVGDWVRRGMLQLGAKGFALKDGAGVEIPDQIHDVWRARVDAVLPEPRKISRPMLECAAILGQEFAEKEWMMVGQDRDQVSGFQDGLKQELVERLMIERLIVRTPQGWAFTQAQFRECVMRIARESGRWVQHHLTCAFALQEHVQTGAEWERLGRHLLEAGVTHEAIPALARGIKGCEATGALRRAMALLALYEQALTTEKVVRDDPRWEWLWGKRATLMWQLGHRRESQFWLDKAIQLSRANQWMKPLRERIGLRVQWAVDDGDAPMARGALEELKSALDDDSDLGEWGTYFRLHGLNDWMLRRFEGALNSLGRARSCFGQVGMQRQNTWCLVPMAWVHLEWGEIDALVAEIERMEKDFREVQDQRGMAYVAFFQSRLARHRENLESSLAWGLEAVSRWQECSAREVVQGQINIGCIRLMQGRYGLARRRFEGALAESEQAQWRHMVCLANVGLLASLAGLDEWGGFDNALATVSQMVRGGRFLEWDSAWPIQLAGQLAAEASENGRARRSFEVSLRVWRFLGNEGRANQVLAAMAHLWGAD